MCERERYIWIWSARCYLIAAAATGTAPASYSYCIWWWCHFMLGCCIAHLLCFGVRWCAVVCVGIRIFCVCNSYVLCCVMFCVLLCSLSFYPLSCAYQSLYMSCICINMYTKEWSIIGTEIHKHTHITTTQHTSTPHHTTTAHHTTAHHTTPHHTAPHLCLPIMFEHETAFEHIYIYIYNDTLCSNVDDQCVLCCRCTYACAHVILVYMSMSMFMFNCSWAGFFARDIRLMWCVMCDMWLVYV
jgi:hypothetical protein